MEGGGGRGFDGEESRLLTWHGVNLLRGRNSIRLRPNEVESGRDDSQSEYLYEV